MRELLEKLPQKTDSKNKEQALEKQKLSSKTKKKSNDLPDFLK
jgi:hypothetical protein